MEHLDVLDAPWKQDNDQMIELMRKLKGCWNCGNWGRVPEMLQEAVPLGKYLCLDCKRAYELGQRHGHRQTEGQLLEHDQQW